MPAFELETDAAARRRREKQRQRESCPVPLRAQQALSRGKKTEEYAHLRVRRRQSAEERKRSLHTNGCASKSTAQLQQQPELKQPHTSREPVAVSEARAARAALDRQRPQSAKPKLEQQQQQQQVQQAPASQRNAIAGKLINVRHWEAWLCHTQPTTASHLAVSQSSPTLGRKDTSATGADLEEQQQQQRSSLDRCGSSAALLSRTSIVVDMRRLRLVSDQRGLEDAPEAPETASRPPTSASRCAWAGYDDAASGDDGSASRA